jgi:hypothetical protein
MIPFLDLSGQYRELKPEIDAAAARVLESGQYAGGLDLRYQAGDFPVTEACANTGLSLLLYSELSAEQVEQMAARVCQLSRQKIHESSLL